MTHHVTLHVGQQPAGGGIVVKQRVKSSLGEQVPA